MKYFLSLLNLIAILLFFNIVNISYGEIWGIVILFLCYCGFILFLNLMVIMIYKTIKN